MRVFDRKLKSQATMNMVWTPYVVSETVMAETAKFTSKSSAKTFAVAAINDHKISTEEAVQTFESLASLQRLTSTLKQGKSSPSPQPEFSCTFQAFIDSLAAC